MNGRVYDYNLGRFMSVDPFIHGGSQGLNPYSYIMNNPLAGTDPTGYAPETETVDVGKEDKFLVMEDGTTYLDQGGDTLVQVDSMTMSGSGDFGNGWKGDFSATFSGSGGLELQSFDIGSQSGLSKQSLGEKARASGCAYTSSSSCNKSGSFNRVSKGVGLTEEYAGDARLHGLSETKFVDDDTGFKSALFENTFTKKFLLAFAGTDSFNDLDDIVGGFFGIRTGQHKQAEAIGLAVQSVVGNYLSFTGHSLGGALAVSAARATGLTATTFNPQGANTMFLNSATRSMLKKNVASYRSSGDILSVLQEMTPFTPNAIGSKHRLSRAGTHGIGAICSSLGTSCDY